MPAAKQEALNAIRQLPDDSDMDDIMYQLYVLDKVRKGQEAMERGKTITSEELKREIDSWQFGQSRLRPILDPSMILLPSTPTTTPRKSLKIFWRKLIF